jgi:chemotaxis protein MotA
MNFVIGIILVIGSVLGSFAAMGGHIGVLFQPFEFTIIFGAAVGAYVIANSKGVIRDTWANLKLLFKGKPYDKQDYLELLSLMYVVFRTGRQNMSSLEKELDEPQNSQYFRRFPRVMKNAMGLRFLADYLRLILLGSEKSYELEALMDEEIETIDRELHKVPKALHVMADAMPALGIVAAVLGVIKAMGSINQPPEVLGRLIGGALTGTFLGVLLSYGFVGPLSSSIKDKKEAELNYFVCIKAGLLAFLNGYPPQICVEYARKVLSTDVRPDFIEVERATHTVTGA